MKVLFILTYYRPHVSGLTIYVERLAKALAARGHQATVLTSRYDPALPRRERIDGVDVVRVPVLFRVNKGVFMPGFAPEVLRQVRAHDVVSIHLPQVEATLATSLARLGGRRPVLTYHCDLQMPPVWYGKAVDKVTYWNNRLAGGMADAIVAYTADFATHSPLLSHFVDGRFTAGVPGPGPAGDEPGRTVARPEPSRRARGKVRVILPPVVIPDPTPEGIRALRARAGLPESATPGGPKTIGFAARFAYEKGAGYLINALPHILCEVPSVRVLFAGPYGKDVIGETIWDELQPLIRKYEPYLTFLGTLSPAEMANFFAVCDVITVASINNTESFGLVQVEAFLCGTPVVATDLPGVRQPVMMTGMGEIVPIADAEGLARGIVQVLQHRERYVLPKDEIRRTFDIVRTVEAYEALFREMQS